MTPLRMATVHTNDEVKLAVPDSIPRRPAKLNMQGREVPVKLNTFNVVAMPSKHVYQYDVSPSFSLLGSNFF